MTRLLAVLVLLAAAYTFGVWIGMQHREQAVSPFIEKQLPDPRPKRLPMPPRRQQIDDEWAAVQLASDDGPRTPAERRLTDPPGDFPTVERWTRENRQRQREADHERERMRQTEETERRLRQLEREGGEKK